MKKRTRYSGFLVLTCLVLVYVFYTSAQDNPACPEAPAPQLVIDEQGRVFAGDPNNMRDVPARAGNLIGAIPGGEVFDVLDGPVCADGFYWWQVAYGGLTGWTVEGSGTDYWIEPIKPNAPTATPLPTRTPTPTPGPVSEFDSPVEAANTLEIGAVVRVLNDEDDLTEQTTLRMRGEPSTSGAVLRTVEVGSLLTIIDGPVEADGFRWWQLEAADRLTGWAIEGLYNADLGRYERTLLPICPYSTDRRADIVERYIITTDHDGSNPCLLDRLRLVAYFDFWDVFAHISNQLIWSPDGTQFAFIDNDGYPFDLYTLSADGSVRTAITHDSHVSWFDWSPDGSRIVFTRTVGGASSPQVWTMRTDGSGLAAQTNGDAIYDWAEWLDNETLIYKRLVAAAPDQASNLAVKTLFTVNITQGGLKEIFTNNWDITRLMVSPDQTHIVIAGFEPDADDPDAAPGPHMIVLDVETGETVYSTDADQHWLFWTPDSARIVYYSEDGSYGVWSVFPETASVTIQLPEELQGDETLKFSDPIWLDDAHFGVFRDDELYSIEVPAS